MIDYSLYLVTDRGLSRGRRTVEVVQQAVLGGVTCVQLREKNCSTREFLTEARALQTLLKPLAVPLIVNDRLDIALAVDAAGVHLGQSDMPLAEARRLLGSARIIGISAESLEDALEAEEQGADYIGISPVFATPTKTDAASPHGLAGVRAIRRRVQLPLVGIGGIGVENAAEVIAAGADGLAVVSAIMSADCPETAARALRQAAFASSLP
ncbi:MAG: thiamine phosphate synthase [Deltaproteobacteria bacterium]|nr:MAG: thiamine phosphate synthase [Deltaproteobacteria bacterium]